MSWGLLPFVPLAPAGQLAVDVEEGDPVYFASMEPTYRTWHLYLPMEWSTALYEELLKRGAKLLPADSPARAGVSRGTIWAVNKRQVPKVLELLQAEGLRHEGPDPSLDEVLATFTPLEMKHALHYNQDALRTLLGRIRWLQGVSDEQYAMFAERARRRLRPDIGEALSTLTEAQLRCLIRQPEIVLHLPTSLRGKGVHQHTQTRPHETSALEEIVPALAEHLKDVAQLRRLVTRCVTVTVAIPPMYWDDIIHEAYPLLRSNRIAALPPIEQEEIATGEFTRLPAERQQYWLQRFAEKEQQDQELKADVQAKERKRLQERKALYQRNKELYPFFGDLVGMTVEGRRLKWDVDGSSWTPTLVRIDQAAYETKTKPSGQKHYDITLNATDLSDNQRLALGRLGSWSTKPSLIFEVGNWELDLEPALRKLLWQNMSRYQLPQRLASHLSPDLVRYVIAAVAQQK